MYNGRYFFVASGVFCEDQVDLLTTMPEDILLNITDYLDSAALKNFYLTSKVRYFN